MVNPEVPNEIITRNTLDYEKRTNNVYESIAVISKRANQIAAKVKEELTDKLQEFQTTSDNLEEVFENREQIEISKFYERQPKATLVALEEFLENKIYHRNPLKES
ncbi:MAG: DNA-directed RNA polymerase subunit omega [Bacteroidetes bacterium]|nr:DNA-directed RNA polymerase subunit omega [Bacteroidota bacterium]MBL0054488.1 DNA-directed RNA polymerase subunit omega [Bacteroidota bacterium]